jgi:hypothetical protein
MPVESFPVLTQSSSGGKLRYIGAGHCRGRNFSEARLAFHGPARGYSLLMFTAVSRVAAKHDAWRAELDRVGVWTSQKRLDEAGEGGACAEYNLTRASERLQRLRLACRSGARLIPILVVAGLVLAMHVFGQIY